MKFYVPQGKPISIPEAKISYVNKRAKRRVITMATAIHPKTGQKLYKIVANKAG